LLSPAVAARIFSSPLPTTPSYTRQP